MSLLNRLGRDRSAILHSHPARIEFEYTRHGTLCLTGNWHVVFGHMITPTIGPTRTEEDFCVHIAQAVTTNPEAGWVFVADNLNTHCSESLVRYRQDQRGRPSKQTRYVKQAATRFDLVYAISFANIVRGR